MKSEDDREPRAIRIIEDRWATFRHIIEAVAIVAAGLWAFYTFVYQERIKPASEPAALSASIAVHRLGRDARRDILSVDLVLHNVGKTAIDIAADGYNVWGLRYGSNARPSRLENAGRFSQKDEIPQVSSHIIDAFVELRDRAVGGQAGHHIVLEPDETERIADVIVVKRGAYDSVLAQVIAVPCKTTEANKVQVDVLHNRNGGYWLKVPNEAGIDEDDNETEFALIP
jgi:hypothetical protein